jgi:hypothetical protein
MGGTDSIDLAQDRDRWRTIFSAVMNLLFPQFRDWLLRTFYLLSKDSAPWSQLVS